MSRVVKGKKKKAAGRGVSDVPTMSTEALLKKAQESMDEFDFDKARKYAAKAAQQSPSNVEALELYAGILLELGEIDKAVERLQKCIQLSPETGHTKYLSMGQLHEGKKALNFFKKGLNVLKQEKGKNPGEEAQYNRKISSVLCAMTDLYLTDLCYEEDAEKKCCDYLAEAEKIDPRNPEVYQTLASVRISQTRTEEAKEMMMKGLNLWFEKEKKRQLDDEKGKGRAEGEDEEPAEQADDDIPSYDFRINTAKILLELEENEKAAEVLEMLLNDDDEVVEVSYLLGYTYFLLKERKAAEDTLGRAEANFKKLGCDDQSIYQHISELLEECKQLEYKPEDDVMEQDDQPEGEGEDQWEDIESSEDEAMGDD